MRREYIELYRSCDRGGCGGGSVAAILQQVTHA